MYRFKVNGQVQGVGFRHATRGRATALGLQGWVRNCDDGCVEGVAGGDEMALQTLREWLQHGPASARVEQLHWQLAIDDMAGDNGFQVRL